tara:strand:+ start:16250 stop:16522 length:273 start_codon:yes stop_codon:yes gene_type:complete
MPEIKEYKDSQDKWRITQKADNGEISDSTHQGYVNKKDAVNGKINTSIEYMKYYMDEMDLDQLKELVQIGHTAFGIAMNKVEGFNPKADD